MSRNVVWRWIAVAVVCVVVAGCTSNDGTDQAETEAQQLRDRVSELESLVSQLEQRLDGCSETVSEPEQQPDPVRIAFVRENYDDLPEQVRVWADHFVNSRVGAHKQHDDRVYIVLSTGGAGFEHATGIQIARIYWTDRLVVVEGAITAPGVGTTFEVVSVDAADWPDPEWTEFNVRGLTPGFRNSRELPLVELPMDERIIVITPTPLEIVNSPLVIRGFASMFEGYVSIRLVDERGDVVAIGGAACGSFWWDSFQAEIEFSAEPGEKLLLELRETAAEGDNEPYGITIPLIVGESR